MAFDLILKDIKDVWVRENFFRLKKFLTGQSLLSAGFVFFEVNIKSAADKFPVPHGLGFKPKDVLVLSIEGNQGTYFRTQDFDTTNVYIKALGAARVRFLIGSMDVGAYPTNSTDAPTFDISSVTSGGTVTSVAMTVPSFLSVSGSPINTSGTLAVTLSGTALPIANGGTGQTTALAAFDALSPLTTAGDLLTFASGHNVRLGTVLADTGKFLASGGSSASNFWTNDGEFLTGLNASSLATGTVPAGRLPNPSSSTLGGVQSAAATSHQWINSISTSGVPALSQPAFSDISSTASLTTQVSGILPVANGGTGQSAYTDGQLLIGNSGTGLVTKATISAGANITVTNGNGSISIAASSAATAAWNYTSQTTTYAAVVNDWVFASGASFTITLPTAVSQAGKSIIIQHAGTSLTQVYTLATTSAQTIGGIASGSYALYTNGEVLFLMSDGTNWQVIEHRAVTDWVDAGAISVSSTSAYTFTIASSTITVGAVYSNNGQQYTMTKSIAAATSITAAGTGAPAASGTLTLVSGSGPGTVSFSAVASSVPVKGTSAEHWWWRRLGSNAEVRYEYIQTGAGTNGTGDYMFAFPTGLLVDTTKLTPYITAALATNSIISAMSGGIGPFYATPTTVAISGQGLVFSTKYLRLGGLSASTAGAGEPGNFVGTIGAFGSVAAQAIMGKFSYPVTGWQP